MRIVFEVTGEKKEVAQKVSCSNLRDLTVPTFSAPKNTSDWICTGVTVAIAFVVIFPPNSAWLKSLPASRSLQSLLTTKKLLTPANVKTPQFINPLPVARVSSNFALRVNPVTGRIKPHKGIDLAAPIGTSIKAASDGTVEFSDWSSGGYGNLVVLRHAGGWTTRYGHAYKLLVVKGQKVKAGQAIAEVGSTGRSTGPHLHFEIRTPNEVAVNPAKFLFPFSVPPSTPPKTPTLKLLKPTKGKFTQAFKPTHEGIDLKAPIGTPIQAASDGTVLKAGWDAWGLGNAITLIHPNGTTTVYGHCSKLLLQVGQQVKRGQIIGEVGDTGNSNGAHLHFEFHSPDGKAIDPVRYLK